MHMDKGAKAWLIKTARKNYWRVCSHYELEDLISDGYVCYYMVLQRYPKAKDPPHIMRLFQLVYMCRITNLARKRSQQVDYLVPDFDLLSQSLLEPEIATTYAHVQAAPTLIKRVLEILASEEGCKKLRSSYRIRKDRTRETVNERLCRLIGIDNCSIDLTAALRKYLIGEPDAV